MFRSAVAIAASLTLLPPALHWALGQSMEELEVDHALTFEFPTPHTDWAQPYALGKTRVLFFTTGHNTAPRECVELMQRFDLEAQAVFYATIVDSPQTHWHGGAIGERRMLNLLEKPWDCFVFLGLGPDKMSAEQLYKLLKQVTEGAGLVLCGSDDNRILKPKNQIAGLPPFLATGPVGDAFTIGKGRGIRLPGRPDIGYYEGWQVDYDHWQERLGRAVLWAAHKEPKARLELTLAKPQHAVEEQIQVTAQLTGSLVGDSPRLELILRGPCGETWGEVKQPITLDAPATFSFANHPAGSYYLDARAISSAGVETWATTSFGVTSSRAVAEVKLDQDWGELGDRLTGRVSLEGAPAQGDTLRVRLLDRRRRELSRLDIPLADAGPKFAFTIQRWMPMLTTVEAQLLNSDGVEVSRAYKYFHVTKRHQGQWNFLIWDVPYGTLAPYAEESLARTGMTLQLRGGNPEPYVAAFETAWVPYTTRILTPKNPEGIMQPFCWNDEEAVRKHVTELAERYRPARQHGVFVYSLGDENETLGCCLSPHCAAAYRKYLQETYGTLEALNAEWGTAFTTWDEVGLSKPDDNEEANSLREGNYARWFDRQAFKSYNYVQYCNKYAKAYAAIDPQARTGFEGAGGFQTGDDLDLIIRTLEFWSPYPGTADEVVRSISPPDFPSANWMGYTKDADSLLAVYWRMVTRGMDAVWWWRWDCIGAFHGWLAPDLRPYPAVQDIIKDTQVVRDGLGDLLLQSQMHDDGIAVLFSYPSVFAHKLAEGASFGGYESAHVAMMENIRDLGLQFRYVTDRALRLGEWDASRYKVLLLVRAEAIGDKEAQVIRRFVEQGGTLIADVRPGIYDDHCKPRGQGALDDLFGITREGKPEAKVAKLVIQQDEHGNPVILEKAALDAGIRVTGERAVSHGSAEGVPAFIVNTVGRGRAILTNVTSASYPKLSAPETPEEAAALLQTILLEAGVQPALKLTDESGGRARGVEVVRWQNGQAQLVALFRRGGQRSILTLEFADGQPRMVYDLRQQSARQGARLTVPILPNRATFLAVCNAEPAQPEIALDRYQVARGTVVHGTISAPGAEGRQAFRLRVTCGDQELQWLNCNLIVGREPVEFDIPVAYNDPVGDYAIRAIDLFTNQSRRVILVVSGS